MSKRERETTFGIRRREFVSSLAAMSLVSGTRVFAAADANDLRIQRLAWAGIRLQLPHATVFIDPLINPDEWGAALKDPLIPVSDAVGDTYVLITHAHGDHFDATAVAAALSRGGALVHPAGMNPLPLPQRARIRPSALWEPQLLGDFTVTAVPASDGYGDPQVSWVVSAAGRRLVAMVAMGTLRLALEKWKQDDAARPLAYYLRQSFTLLAKQF